MLTRRKYIATQGTVNAKKLGSAFTRPLAIRRWRRLPKFSHFFSLRLRNLVLLTYIYLLQYHFAELHRPARRRYQSELVIDSGKGHIQRPGEATVENADTSQA